MKRLVRGSAAVATGQAQAVAGQQDVVVLGSANLDVTLGVARIPRPGETVLATGRALGPGGKGANQAVAAARSGARTGFVCALGDDDAAGLLRAELAAAGVDLDGVRTVEAPTGTAYVVVEASGENAIVVDLGANDALTALTDDERALVRDARVLLCQLEIPLQTVADAVALASGLAVLNAAPAQPLPDELTSRLDVLVVNEQEALAVSGEATVEAAVARLVERVPEVVVTLGAAGALVAVRGGGTTSVAGVAARSVVDTTGAGDTFCGAFAAARADGADAVAAVRVACAAASLSVERPGASRAAPTAEEVRVRLADVERSTCG